jgi:uncharacterized protein YgiB involved in biofilm formation
MKLVILAIIAGVAGFLAYTFFKGACTGGRIVATEAECRATFGADACRLAFTESRRKATEDYAPFSTLESCQRAFPLCEPHRVVASGFVPVPTGACVVSNSGGTTGTPIYERIGKRFN